MGRKRKRILAFAAAAVLLALAAVLLFLSFKVEAYRSKFEAAASGALGMEVRIGRMRLALSPPFGVMLDDLYVRHREVDLVRAKRVRVGLRLLPLLRREVRFAELRLVGPSFDVRRRGTGRLDVERYLEKPLRRSRELLPGALSRISRVVLSDGALVYSNAETGNRISMEGIEVALANVSLGDRPGTEPAWSAFFTGTIDIGKADAKGFVATGVKTQVRAADGVVVFDPISMTVFGGSGNGRLVLDASGEVPVVEARYFLPRFRIERALDAFSRREIVQGESSFSAKLSMTGASFRQMKKTVGGEVTVRGANLVLPYGDLDRILSSSGEGGAHALADAAALFLAGPFGAALPWEGEVAGGTGGGPGAVRELVSTWRVTGGVADARDVALSTARNRIALRGALDLGNGRFNDVAVALLDAKGCAAVRRAIGGTFRDPEIGKASRREVLEGPSPPTRRVVQRSAAGKKCMPFYSGSVAPPRGSHPGDP